MNETTFNVLFLCVENSARSIMAEAILNHCGKPRFRAFSAGIAPRGEVEPLALELLEGARFSIEGLRSKGVEEFVAAQSPRMDFVISLCEGACPTELIDQLRGLGGDPFRAHWGIADPAAATSPVERRRALTQAFRELETRIRLFVLLRHDESSRSAREASAP